MHPCTVEVAIDARDQAVAMCFALCPPPTIRNRSFVGPPRVTNDVVRLIGERWVLTPARRFIVKSVNESCRNIVASIGATLGVISAEETDEWTHDHTFSCWLGCDRLLARCYRKQGTVSSQFSSQIIDWSKSPGHNRVWTIRTPELQISRFWGNHKWALGFTKGNLFIHRAIPSPESLWVSLEIPDSWNVDVVFSHTVPGLIGFGDEASVLAKFMRSLYDHVRNVMTVDLERSFSSGSLVVVKEGRELTTRESGHSFAVENDGACGAFVSNLTTGERTKLSTGWLGFSKAGNELVRAGKATYNVFTCQPCTSIIFPNDEYQPLMDRGLIAGKETSTGASTICRAVIDSQTGLTLCRFRTRCYPHSSTTLAFL